MELMELMRGRGSFKLQSKRRRISELELELKVLLARNWWDLSACLVINPLLTAGSAASKDRDLPLHIQLACRQERRTVEDDAIVLLVAPTAEQESGTCCVHSLFLLGRYVQMLSPNVSVDP